MLAMDPGSDDELRMLRARAYGPSADIGNDPAALPSINGPVYYGCRAGGFPATVQLDVDATTPSALRDRVAKGSALLFVLDHELVGVFSDEG
jgi:hypothetical protein